MDRNSTNPTPLSALLLTLEKNRMTTQIVNSIFFKLDPVLNVNCSTYLNVMVCYRSLHPFETNLRAVTHSERSLLILPMAFHKQKILFLPSF